MKIKSTQKTLNRLSVILVALCLSIVTLGAKAQSVGVSGTVTDTDGEPLVGATVLVTGQSTGTSTDINGFYSIAGVAPGAKLSVSYIGYLPQEKEVPADGKLDFVLKANGVLLDEVVAIGYTVQKKSVVTASIAKVDKDVLAQTAPVRVDNALRGLASGVQVMAGDGQPGSGTKVRIRGTGTINDSDPLYIIDGMPVNGGIDNINPADIESIEILKDAASAAVYGARAANGVVLITTKKGQMGTTRVSYDFSYGWQNPWRKRSMLNATEYVTIMNEAQQYNNGTNRFDKDPASYGTGTNWQDELFNDNAPVQNHQLSISGANEKINYFFSAGYYNQEGIIGGNYNASNYERLSLRSNTIFKLFDVSKERNWLKSMTFTSNIAYSRINSRGITAGNLTGSALADALFLDPTMQVYDPDGTTIQNYDHSVYGEPVVDKITGQLLAMPSADFNETANPLARLSRNQNGKNNSDKIIANINLELGIWDNLRYKFSWGSDLAFWGYDTWNEPAYLNKNATTDNSKVQSEMNRGYRWQIENVLYYDKQFGEHSVNVVLGQSAQRSTSRALTGNRFDLPEYRDDKAYNLDFATGLASDGRRDAWGGLGDPSSLASYFGQLSYNFAERYMLQVTFRRDGSSRFGSNNKWATFPSVSAGWNITNEQFMAKRPTWYNWTKLRLSWGTNGNEQIGNFRYTAFTATGNNYPFGAGSDQKFVLGSKPTITPNADLRWEESEQYDAGLDFGFFNGGLTVGIDYFYKKTNGMLKEKPVPSYLGESRPWGNVGSMKNEGWEFEIGWNHHHGDWDFGASLNLSYLKNKLINLGNADGFEMNDHVHNIGNISRSENGYPYPFFYGFLTDGVIQNAAEAAEYNAATGSTAVPGDIRFVDRNENGSIDDGDKTMIGKGTPDWTMGLNLTARWKGIDFSMLLTGVFGNDIVDVTRRTDLSYVNLPAEFMDRWHGEGTSNTMPRFTFPGDDKNKNWTRFSDLFIKNGSFARIKNMQIGYTLPQDLTRRFFVQRLRVYVAAENLATFTSYKGLDPELANDKSNGIDRGYYPQARTFTVGLNVNF